ncbi:MAG: hypothetical protein EAY65_05040 [Alphaproteobacteria bacterium]|nr:MAG: hypothetical protein EAY65_05040 [Alphaproteobacteria bacterium]
MKYHFAQESSSIKDCEIFKKRGTVQAKIILPDDEKICEYTKQTLDGLGYRTLRNVEKTPEGGVRSVLTLHKTEGAEELIRDMYRYNLVTGDYSAELTEHEQKENKTFKQWVQDNVLSLSGALYVTADSFLLASGLMRNDMPEVMNGILWLLPNASLVLAGNQDPNSVLGFMKRDFLEDLERNNIAVPSDARAVLEHGMADHGLKNRLTELIYNVGPSVNNTFELVGGSQMIMAGLKQGNMGKTGAGVLVVTGMGLSLVLDEKKKAEQGADNIGVGRVANPSALNDNAVGIQADGGIITPKEEKGWFSDITPQWWPGQLGKLNNILNITGALNEIVSFNLAAKPGEKGFAKIGFAHEKDSSEIGIGWRGQTTQKGSDEAIHNKNWYHNRIQESEGLLRSATRMREDYLTNDSTHTVQDKGYQDLLMQEKGLSAELGEYRAKCTSAKASFLNLAAGCTFFIANNLYAHSHKENSSDLGAINAVDTMVSVAATIVAAQPEEKREIMTDRLAVILAQGKYMRTSIDVVSDLIADKVAGLTASKGTPEPMLLEVLPQSHQRMVDPIGALQRA